ncbi:hypothetical protein D3C81_1594050 [compost metagenome]
MLRQTQHADEHGRELRARHLPAGLEALRAAAVCNSSCGERLDRFMRPVSSRHILELARYLQNGVYAEVTDGGRYEVPIPFCALKFRLAGIVNVINTRQAPVRGRIAH